MTAARLLVPWEEGNGWVDGNDDGGDRGSGAGVTWNCPVDADITDQEKGCEPGWDGAQSAAAAPSAAGVIHTPGLTGEVAWDVSADILAGAEHGWLIRKETPGGGGDVAYHARESAEELGDADLAPRLILQYAREPDACVEIEPTDLAALDLTLRHFVRGVFFVPRDRAFRSCLHERLDTWIQIAQRFYREEMAHDGYLGESGEGKAFRYETGEDGRWNVVYMIGEEDAAFYQAQGGFPGGAAFGEMLRRLPPEFHNNNVTVYIYDHYEKVGDSLLHTGQGGLSAPWEGEGAGYVLQGAHFLGVGFDTVATRIEEQAAQFEDAETSGLTDLDGNGELKVLTRGEYASTDLGAAIHELGHAFNLGHDFTDYDGDGIETNIMGNGFRRFSGRYTQLGFQPPTALGPTSAAELDAALLFNAASPDVPDGPEPEEEEHQEEPGPPVGGERRTLW